ncbi:S-formylglutathione hydrolase [Thalassotalea sp. Y01]|uniref:S-formylglutathione hydrolase n=1 Tax=Thalassotalea sp. Y01 TaxID=2729613 RepID=UPI00145D4581|nr:S-formylglutathione hydrolase [Thalassotalea sp. Y01]NMP17422.1 S-formylglutathione hydrolase [Thalassotalea sp. Y01]
MEKLSDIKCFSGRQLRYKHDAATLNCEMTFSIFLPSQATQKSVPVLYWLSGLTCTDENFVTKAGAQQFAEKYQVALVAADTSPRGDNVKDDEQGAYDFGLGAGFYVNATEPEYAEHYNMYDYIVDELPALINAHFPVDGNRAAIFGHSMGGHGAITIALKNRDKYTSVSAFAPICSPMRCPWGHKALAGYLGDKQGTWQQYDSCYLIEHTNKVLPLLIDQGTADNFLIEQLKPELLQQACVKANYPLQLRMQQGYDHSYFFISSFIEQHIAFHAEHLSSLD